LEPETHISLGLTLSVPLFKPGQNADYREATIDWKKAEISITETRRTLEIQAQKASLALNDAATRKNIALKVFEAAKLQAEVYRNRYTLGMISFQDWNSAETEFIESERKLLDAKYAFADAWADMDAAYGKGLEVAGL